MHTRAMHTPALHTAALHTAALHTAARRGTVWRVSIGLALLIGLWAARGAAASKGVASENAHAYPSQRLDEAEGARRRELLGVQREAQYRRNLYAVQVAFGREVVKTPEEARGYSGRVEFAMLLPSEDGASPLWVVQMGLSGWSADDEDRNGNRLWGLGMPFAFGYGYRTPWLIGYGGLSFGLGMDRGAEPAVGSYGTFANLGVDFVGVRLLGDTRAEYRTMKAGDSRWHLTYGVLLSVDL